LENGAKIYHKNKDGLTAYDVIKSRQNVEWLLTKIDDILVNRFQATISGNHRRQSIPN